MKRILLFFWNLLIDIKIKLNDFIHYIIDFFYQKKHKPPKIMSCEETVKYILKTGCSVSRFGDGELKLISGKNICFQVSTQEIRDRLNQVIGSDKENLLVCIPSVFSDNQLSDQIDSAKKFWKHHLSYCRKYWYQYLIKNKTYGNAFISRCYINVKNKDKEKISEYFTLIKKLWDNKNIIVVEGEKSRLGMGNDLFDNAKSVKRILGPSDQGYSKYNELLEEIKKQDKNSLIFLALGPTATILPYDLCDLGYQAIDIGNIDTEYEWFKMNASEKVPIKNKMVYEAGKGKGVGDIDDEKYNSEIISKIL